MVQRWIWLIGIALAAAVCAPVSAAERVVTVNPVNLLLYGDVVAEYEEPLNRNTTRAIQGFLGAETILDTNIAMLVGGLGVRRYLTGRALEGLYVGGDAQAFFQTARNSFGDTASGTVLRLQAVGGYQWVRKSFVADFQAVAYTSFYNTGGSYSDVDWHVMVGYAW